MSNLLSNIAEETLKGYPTSHSDIFYTTLLLTLALTPYSRRLNPLRFWEGGAGGEWRDGSSTTYDLTDDLTIGVDL